MPMIHARPIAAGLFGALCAFAGDPAAAEATAPRPEEPKAEFRPQQVASGLYVMAAAGGNITVWTGTDGILLADDGSASEAQEMLAAVARIAPGPVRFVVNTHWHPDHTGGNEQAARSGAVIIAHEATRTAMSTAQVSDEYSVRIPASPQAALPSLTFPDEISLHLNGDRLAIVHAAAAHGGGDAVLWWENANVVHLGDVYYNGAYPFVDLANGGSLAGMVAAIEGVLSRADADTVIIPGHGPVSGRADLAAYRDMLVAAGRRVRELVEQGRSLDEVLAARPTEAFDDRYGKGMVSPERFVRILYADLASRR